MDKMKSLNDLFIHELSDLYSAEKQLTKALPKMAKAATSPDLRAAFEEHLEQTQGHVARLEQVFSTIGATPKRMVCKAMEGLVEEGKEMIEKKKEAEPATLDAGLIAAAQRVEHYEMAGYGTVVTFAQTLGHREAASILKETLNEEKTTDKLLSKLAVSSINPRARKGEGEPRWRPEETGKSSRSGGTRGSGKGTASAGRRRTSGKSTIDSNVDNYRGENAKEMGTSSRAAAPNERRGGR